MRNLLFIMTALILCVPQCEKEPVQGPGSPVNIPDPYFLKKLKLSGVDANRDGSISFEEAEAVTSLTVNNSATSELTGIEAFVNLGTLIFDNNLLSGLDISANTGMYNLILRDMPIRQQICVWEVPFIHYGELGIDLEGSPNAYFTVDCMK